MSPSALSKSFNMYVPRRYEQKETKEIIEFVKDNSFGLLVSNKSNRPIGTHIPFLISQKNGIITLSSHISRGNEQKHTLTEGAEVLVVFAGPHSYISPQWYTQPNVPTWNYISVHMYGTIQIIEGEAVHSRLTAMVDKYEQFMPKPMQVKDIPEKMYNDDVRGIVVFDITVTEVQAAYKLSQNRDEESYQNIIDKLEQSDANGKAVATAMRKQRNK
jgi:transcriptional regulator